MYLVTTIFTERMSQILYSENAEHRLQQYTYSGLSIIYLIGMYMLHSKQVFSLYFSSLKSQCH